MNIGIIGSAGRKEDGCRLNRTLWVNAVQEVEKVVVSHYMGLDHILISGGAALADHIAVDLFHSFFPYFRLHLHLPVEFKNNKFLETPNKYDPGSVANYYHGRFSSSCQLNSLFEISDAINKGAEVSVTPGFKQRNTRVAQDSNVLIALTFGNGRYVKPGGTQDTCIKYLRLGKKELWHIDLNTMKAYKDGAV